MDLDSFGGDDDDLILLNVVDNDAPANAAAAVEPTISVPPVQGKAAPGIGNGGSQPKTLQACGHNSKTRFRNSEIREQRNLDESRWREFSHRNCLAVYVGFFASSNTLARECRWRRERFFFVTCGS